MTSSMNKGLLLVAFMLTCLVTSAQDVRYYQLSSTRIGGTTNKNVSGGQFVTFVSDICFESTSKGVGVGHGTLTRNKNYSNSQYTTYQGSSYWGSSTTFKFNADKSVLNVVLDNGDIYVYKRATPPAGVTTCSLIRPKSNSSSSGYTPPPTYPVQQYPQQQYLQQQNPQQYNQPQQQQTPTYQQPKDCTICHGSGKCNTCNGRGYYTNLGLGSGTHPCPNCPNHSGRCQWCNGTGKQK